MCGIVGYIGNRNASEVLVEGLRRLEYRGYDSAGVAIMNGKGVELRRSLGKLAVLENLLKEEPIVGTMGVGHTRWATHGRPSEVNAHPHACCQKKFFVVHNGIIENYDELKKQFEAKGHIFRSQTDTEVLAHAIEECYQGDLLAAVRCALELVKGSYALGVVCETEKHRLIAARKDSPLVLGIGENEMFVASDVPALLPHTRHVIFLEDGDIAEISKDQIKLFNAAGELISRKAQTIDWDPKMAEKGGKKHFMLKEIYEQSETVANALRGRLDVEKGRVKLEDVLPAEVARRLPKICLEGCGTSYHAGLVARFWMEEIAKISCDVEIASELRYMRAEKPAETLLVAITQSGETADTLAALRESKKKGLPTLSVCNVVGATATRDADHTLYIQCGPEIGVASTKAFTGQLTALLLLALYIAQCRKSISDEQLYCYVNELALLPALFQSGLDMCNSIESVARQVCEARDFLFLGRHLNFPVALEGALKMKEISYIHAEGYPAGEMKHGPIALIDTKMPVVAIAPRSSVHAKVLSNIEEVRARGGKVIAVAQANDEEVAKKADAILPIPACPEFMTPLLTVIPLQLLAYHVAVLRGCDVDQPRNLAKSVTVE